jgi:uncharacterized repeat protein (TIGR01451 family)
LTRLLVAFATLLFLSTSLLVASGQGATIRGTNKSETLRGTPAADSIRGLRGNDKLYGFAGNDYLDGGPGRDLISGGRGNDLLVSRDGVRDLLRCGPGRDEAFVDLKDRVSDCEKVTVPLLPPTFSADLSLALSAPPDPVALNADLTYVATVTNIGPDVAYTASLSFVLPNGATYVGASTATGSCQLLTPRVSCSLGDIAPDTALTASLVIRVLGGTTVVVAANASSETKDMDSSNNSASVTSNVSAPPPTEGFLLFASRANGAREHLA